MESIETNALVQLDDVMTAVANHVAAVLTSRAKILRQLVNKVREEYPCSHNGGRDGALFMSTFLEKEAEWLEEQALRIQRSQGRA